MAKRSAGWAAAALVVASVAGACGSGTPAAGSGSTTTAHPTTSTTASPQSQVAHLTFCQTALQFDSTLSAQGAPNPVMSTALLQHMAATAPAGVRAPVDQLQKVLLPLFAALQRGDAAAANQLEAAHTTDVQSASLELGRWVGSNCQGAVASAPPTTSNLPTGPGNTTTFCAQAPGDLRALTTDLDQGANASPAALRRDAAAFQRLEQPAPPSLRGDAATAASFLGDLADALAQGPAGSSKVTSVLGNANITRTSLDNLNSYVTDFCG